MRREWKQLRSLRFWAGVLLSLVLGVSITLGQVFTPNASPAWAQADTAAEGQAPSLEAQAKEEAPVLKAEEPKPAAKPDTELTAKIDVNNTILRNYRYLPGFYPGIAKILVQNAPYKKLEDILAIPELTPAQKERIKANLDNFVAGPYREGDNQLENRINKGYYG